MNRNDQTAERIGRMLDAGLDTPFDAGTGAIGCVQAVFEAMAAEPLPVKAARSRRIAAWVSAAAAACILALGGALYARWASASIAYQIGDGVDAASSAEWVQNTKPAVLPIRFDNGSLFLLDEGSTAKVVESDRRLVRIDLRSGAVSANVQGNGRTEWVVAAGPYRVKVLGTAFKVTWQDGRRLRVSVTRGRVSVQGNGVGDGGVVLAAGQTLLSSDQNTRIFKTADAPSEAERDDRPETASPTLRLHESPPRDADDATAEHNLLPGKRPAGEASRGATAASAQADTEGVGKTKDTLDATDWAAAARSMTRAEFRTAADTADQGELWHLGDAARRARRFEEAGLLFVAIRERFPDTERAAVSAFLLGKTALDANGDAKTAVRWLRVYLDEAPAGDLAEEALGRLMEAYRSLGRRGEATAVAHDYLKQFPKGTYKGEATRLLEE